jgi:hypothetical protein
MRGRRQDTRDDDRYGNNCGDDDPDPDPGRCSGDWNSGQEAGDR